ncbi:hypothetical protein AVEN_163519-1 [Araneus ventricosus]|uniref:Uncharacterized protein n=1 Tax=Araneus ventricosus TaxID=182803 RepID=A0A4Y2BQ60_ARAVE|nr:hypothetical protein AVEN_163519-1 [Araneus ventricosus]
MVGGVRRLCCPSRHSSDAAHLMVSRDFALRYHLFDPSVGICSPDSFYHPVTFPIDYGSLLPGFGCLQSVRFGPYTRGKASLSKCQ